MTPSDDPVTTFATRLLCLIGLLAVFGCMAHPPAERVELPHTWVKSRQEWLSTKSSRLAWVTYVMDAGSVVAYLTDERGRRWDLFLESPGRGGSQLDIKIKLDEENDATIRVTPGSSEEAHLVAQLRHAKVNER